VLISNSRILKLFPKTCIIYLANDPNYFEKAKKKVKRMGKDGGRVWRIK